MLNRVALLGLTCAVIAGCLGSPQPLRGDATGATSFEAARGPYHQALMGQVAVAREGAGAVVWGAEVPVREGATYLRLHLDAVPGDYVPPEITVRLLDGNGRQVWGETRALPTTGVAFETVVGGALMAPGSWSVVVLPLRGGAALTGAVDIGYPTA